MHSLFFLNILFISLGKKAIQSEELERERRKSRTQGEGEGQTSKIQERKERNFQGHERERSSHISDLPTLPAVSMSPLLLPEGLVFWEDSAGGEGAPSTFTDMLLGIYLCNLPSASQRISNVLRRVSSWRAGFIYYAP